MRLIDADALPIKYDGHTVGVWKNDLDAAPTIDAEPVRHGRWGESDEHPGMRVCSVCSDCYVCEEWLYDPKWHYCPNCGCRMDLED